MLADSIPQLVWMAEADGRIFWVNSRWCDYTGAPTGDGSAHVWQALLAPASLPEARRRWVLAHQMIERLDAIPPSIVTMVPVM
jgi:PAS domain-containing protein